MKDKKISEKARKTLIETLSTPEAKKKRSETSKKIWLNPETKKKISGKNSYLWKGGYKNIPLYDTYAHQIEWCEKVRRSKEDENILEVKCTY